MFAWIPTPARPPLLTALRALLVGVLPGLLIYGGLFVLCVTAHAQTEYMGVSDDNLTSTIMEMFDDAIMAQQLRLLATYLGIGAIVGLFAWAWWELVGRVRGAPLRWWTHLTGVLALTFLIHCWFMVRSAATYPQLYAPQVANSTLLQVLVDLGTDVLSRGAIAWIGRLFALSGLAFIAVLLARAVRAHDKPRAVGWAAAGLVAGVLVAVVGAGEPDAPDIAASSDPARPNVLVLGVDSLRADVLHTGVTPNIERYATRGTLFPNTYTVMPRTYPSWASILTGQFPHHHGIRHMFPPPDKAVVRGSIAKVLGDAGYRTAVISDFAGDVFTRGDFGFEHTDAPPFTLASNVSLAGLKIHVHLMPYIVDLLEGRSEETLKAYERLADPFWLNDRATDWLAEGEGRPFFLTVFYSAGHFPFAAPAPWYQRFVDAAYRGRSRFHKESFGKPLDGADQLAEQRHLKGLFLGALSASDAAIGELLDQLDAQGVLDNTIIVITADHGENLYEHGLGVGHGDHLYGLEALRVPLVLIDPGRKQRRLVADETVSLIDIAPTLLARLGLKPAVEPDGADLAPLAAAPGSSRTVFAETGLWFFPPETRRLEGKRIEFAEGFGAFRYDPKTWAIYLDPRYEGTAVMAKHRMMLEGDRKLLYIPTRDGVRLEMYDPFDDPGETRELSTVEPARFQAMRAKMYEWLTSAPGMQRVGDFVLPGAALGEAGPDAAEAP